MKKELICIECPRGCVLTATDTGNGDLCISGNHCPRGADYARAEVTCPRRILTGTVRGVHGRIPVRTDSAVRKELMLPLMKVIHAVQLTDAVRAGDIIVENIDGEGHHLIASSDG